MATNLPAGTPQAAGASLANSSLFSVGQASDELRNAFGRLGEGMKEFGRAAVSTSDSFSKYNTAIRGATIAASDIAKQFGAVGMAISAVIRIFGGLTTSVLAQNDALIKAKDQLNQVGFNSEMTAEEIGKMARQVGYTTKNLEEYIGVVRSVGTGLITMGKNAGEGSKAFMRLSAVGLDVQTNFAKVGISQTDLVKHQAHYIKLMQIQGLQVKDRATSETSLQKASLEYVKNLLLISSLTGEDIEQIKARQEQLRAEEHFRLSSFMKAQQADELDRKTGDADAKRRAAELRKEIKDNERMSEVASRYMDAQEMAGFNQMLVTGTYTDISKRFAATGEDWIGKLDELRRTGNFEELDAFIARSMKNTVDRFGQAALYNMNEVRSNVFIGGKALERAGQQRGLSEREANERMAKLRAKLEADLTGTADSIAQDRKIRQKAEREVATTLENLQRLAAGPVSAVFNIFMKGLHLAAKGLFKVFGWIRPSEAAKIEHLFLNIEDIPKALSDVAQEIRSTTSEFENIKEANKSLLSPEELTRQSGTLSAEIKEKEDSMYVARGETLEIRRQRLNELSLLRQRLEDLKKQEESRKKEKELEKKIMELKSKKLRIEEQRSLYELQAAPSQSGGSTGTTGPTGIVGSAGQPTSGASGASAGSMMENPQEVARQLNLRLKSGPSGALTTGAKVSSRVFDLAQSIQSTYGKIFITGLDDQYHRDKRPGSAHTRGLAMDFHFMDENQKEIVPKNAEEAAGMLAAFRGMGASNAIDHYFSHKEGIVGDGHYHVEVPGARFGISPRRIKAATSGQLMAVHDNEIVAPLDPNSIIAKLLTASPSEADAILGGRMNNDLADTFRSGFSELSSKVSELVAQMETLNSTEDQMLRYTRSA